MTLNLGTLRLTMFLRLNLTIKDPALASSSYSGPGSFNVSEACFKQGSTEVQ